ncbi:MAG TPA: hypothetical protein VLR26_15150, partial [Frankiaceae bacterium]|nr:hypothetical protein [Frankiaceae bacterium]
MFGLRIARAAAEVAARSALTAGGLGVASVGVAGGTGIGIALGCRDLASGTLSTLANGSARLVKKVGPRPDDPAGTAALTLGVDLVALAGAGLARATGLGRAPRIWPAAVSLVSEQRWLRAPIDDLLGQARSDLLLTLLGAASRAATGDTATLSLDAAQHAVMFTEQLVRKRTTGEWQQRLTG